MLQFGGHHLAINVTMVGSNNVMTPSLPAAQPARYVLNGQTIRPLGNENDKGFALINALDENQKKQAILNYQVRDLVLGPGNDGKVIQPEGMLASAMNAKQQEMLLDVVHEWVGILNDEGRNSEDGGGQGKPAENLFRVERVDDQRRGWRITGFRDRPSSSSTRRNRATSITFIRSIVTRRMTMARGL